MTSPAATGGRPAFENSGLRAARTALLAAGAGYGVLILGLAVLLPPRIPERIELDGTVSGAGDKAELLIVAAVAGVLIAALGSWGYQLLGRVPWLNVPHRRYWSRPENVVQWRALLQVDLAWLSVGMLVLMGGAYAAVGAAALGTPLAPWLFPVLLVILVGGLLAYALRMQFGPRYRPPVTG